MNLFLDEGAASKAHHFILKGATLLMDRLAQTAHL